MTRLAIRDVQAVDYNSLVQLVHKFLEEEYPQGTHNHFFGVDIDDTKVYKWIKDCENNQDRYIKVVTTDTGHIVGGIAGYLSTYTFSSGYLATDLLVYLEPSFKSLRMLNELVDGFVSWAQQQGATEVMISTSTGYKAASYGKYLSRKGFSLSAFGYTRRFD